MKAVNVTHLVSHNNDLLLSLISMNKINIFIKQLQNIFYVIHKHIYHKCAHG